MGIYSFVERLAIKKRAEEHASMIVSKIQDKIPAEYRLPDDVLTNLLIESSFKTELAIEKHKENPHGRD